MAFFSRTRLSYKIFLTLTGVLVSLFLLSGYVVQSYIESILTKHFDEDLNTAVIVAKHNLEATLNLSIRNYLRATSEHSRQLVQAQYQDYKDGKITEQLAKQEAARLLRIERIGKSGYVYVVSSNGRILAHPQESLLGSDLSNYPFIQEQMQRRTGFLEYEWRNPGEDNPRNKALYMNYFAPWDWVISATAYRDELTALVQRDDLTSELNTLDIMENGYPFLISRSGDMIVHPSLHDNVFLDKTEQNRFFQKILAMEQGTLRVPFTDPTTGTSSVKIAFFSPLRDFGWIIGAIGDTRDYYRPLAVLKKLFLTSLILTILASILISYLLSRSITKPLHGLLQTLSEYSEESPSDLPSTTFDRNEIEELTEFFRIYIVRLKDYNEQLSDLLAKQKQTALDLSIFKALFQNSAEGIAITDLNGTIIQANPAFTKITGYPHAEVIGQNPRLLKSGRHEQDFYIEMWEAIDTAGFWSGEIWNKRKDGEIYPEWLTISAIRDEQEKNTHYAALFSDITTIIEQQKRIEFLAYHDYLTELPNRLNLFERMKQLLAACKRHGGEVIFMIIDLDNFKTVNDSMGHDTGDQLLKMLVKRLKPLMRTEDTLCRIGGDDFVYVFRNDQDREISVLAVINRLYKCVEEPFVFGEHKVYQFLSIGIAVYPEDGQTTEDLFKRADMALYSAKRENGNSFQFFRFEMEVEVNKKLHLLTKIRNGLDRQEFIPFFQPKIDLTTGRVDGVEALARWQSEERLIPPGDFIPISEQSGLIVPLAEQIYRKAFHDILTLHQQGFNIRLAVNLSPVQLQAEKFLETFLAIQRDSGLTPEFIELEVTESSLMKNVERSRMLMNSLADAGFALSIDDFGTGYSSLQYLKQIPLTTLKVDRSFVIGIGSSKDDETLIRTIVLMARQFGLKIVAEGVEEKHQEAFLQQLGCNYGQGYYYGKPMDLKTLGQWLAERNV